MTIFDNSGQVEIFWQFWQFLTILTILIILIILIILTILEVLDNFYNYNFDNDNDNHRDVWPLRHWLQFWQLRTWIHDSLCDLTIKSDTGQHSQFLRCFLSRGWGKCPKGKLFVESPSEKDEMCPWCIFVTNAMDIPVLHDTPLIGTGIKPLRIGLPVIGI